jgi:hypothetical protein
MNQQMIGTLFYPPAVSGSSRLVFRQEGRLSEVENNGLQRIAELETGAYRAVLHKSIGHKGASPLLGQIKYYWIASFQFEEGPCLPHILQPHGVARPFERGRAEGFLRFGPGLASLPKLIPLSHEH